MKATIFTLMTLVFSASAFAQCDMADPTCGPIAPTEETQKTDVTCNDPSCGILNTKDETAA